MDAPTLPTCPTCKVPVHPRQPFNVEEHMRVRRYHACGGVVEVQPDLPAEDDVLEAVLEAILRPYIRK